MLTEINSPERSTQMRDDRLRERNDAEREKEKIDKLIGKYIYCYFTPRQINILYEVGRFFLVIR